VPWRKLVPPARRTIMRPESDYSLWMASQGMADVVAAGGYGSIGGHFQQPTLSTHWNIWAAARAMGAHDALKVASLHGAHFLGIDRDVGSLETGKLADLIVLDSNPLEAIERTTDILYVMKGGVLYNADTLDEEWPRARPFGAYPWRNPDIFRTDDRPVEYWDKRP
jgi:imidazolonepropionase-like amidohydrolase